MSADVIAGFVSLVLLELVLGIDNIVLISILSGKLPPAQQDRARRIGLGLAMIMRLLLLLALSWVVKLTEPLFGLFGQGISGRDLILILGGFFLLAKGTYEIHDSLENAEGHDNPAKGAASFAGVLTQIVLLDIVFSLDSVITAVGMVDELWVMVAAVVVSVGVMLVAAGPLGRFVNRHPSVKMLALSFLLLIGVTLIADGFEVHVSKGYIYVAMGFSLAVELLNIRASTLRARRAARKEREPVRLRQRYSEDEA
ncbi:hypothetical protein Afil01_08270 [Actinorhabdospora filicis]|uniref:TerC family protein n=1 Tax=Actinorhabdospora filicis TaxID=1785913 RepID=A0A9W6SHD9_9ACTN|nr:TerC family protein [Actinorhabdospora filicis]GLZ76020.1 hypothetical protein Afil01_08270 [Actinorhabdospora filicis]